MTASLQLDTLLQQLRLSTTGETNDLEFKESSWGLSKDVWETYSAFANTTGGYIILGVKEKPAIEPMGVVDPERIVKELCDQANNKEKVSHNIIKDKNIRHETIDGKTIIIIYVPELRMGQKPLYLNNNLKKTYIRKNSGDYIASEEELRRFLRNAQENLDNELLEHYTEEDLCVESILTFKNLVHQRNPSKQYLAMDNRKFLLEMGIFQIDRKDSRKAKLTLAGLLFLGKYQAIIQRFPHFHLEYIDARGTQHSRWRDRVSSGDIEYPDLNLLEFYRIVYEKLSHTIEEPFKLDEHSRRKSVVELRTALREALANIVIHADYFDSESEIKVTVENFCYTFSNPGAMKVPRLQFFTGGKSLPRNNTLISFFRRIGASERAGTGGREILDAIQANQYRPPELVTTMAFTQLKIWIADSVEDYPDLAENDKKVLKVVRERVQVSMREIMEDTGLSLYFTRKSIQILLERELLEANGKGRATVYRRKFGVIDVARVASHLHDMVINPNMI